MVTALLRLWSVSVLLLTGLLTQAQAPSWQSAMVVGSTAANATSIVDVRTDASGNVYLLGYFSNTITLGGTTLVSAGSFDTFVAKWNPATSTFLWAVRAGGPGDDFPNTLAVNGASIYLMGNFKGASATFGTTTLVNPESTTQQFFVAKLTDAGTSATFTWALAGGGIGTDYGAALAVRGNVVYLAGEYYGNPTTTIGGTTLQNLNAGSVQTTDAFLARITDAGATAGFNWVVPLPYNSANGEGITALAATSTGFYVSGYANYRHTLGVGVYAQDDFLTKVLDTGNAISYGWTNACKASHITVDGANVYLAGSFSGPTVFGSTTLVTLPTVPSPVRTSNNEVYVAKLLDAGTTSSFLWAKQSISFASGDVSIGKMVLSGTAIYLTGRATTATSFGNTTIASGGYVAKLTDAGSNASFSWAKQATGSVYTGSLILSGSTIYVSGSFNGQVAFGNTGLTGPAAGNTNWAFLATLADAALPTRNAALQAATSLYPNPAHGTATVQLPAGAGPAVLTLLDALGRAVRTQAGAPGTTTLDLDGLAPGVYALRVQAGEALAVRQLVIE